MIDKVVAKRYAEAFLESVKSSIGMEKAAEELMSLRDTVFLNRELKSFILNMQISVKEKCDLFDKAFGANLSKETLQFVKFVFEKGRTAELMDIAVSADSLYRHAERAEGVVRSTIPLKKDVIDEIRVFLEGRLHKKVELKTEIDYGLIAGVQVIVDNMIIDGSVKKRLEELKEKLISIKVG
ncbi:MAG: ATP synthase F1 subunit delta [Candidatus Omnitrophica bacterium]|nr:ATP synthase F1 subunit delta [Candidatus Omnitrophota bacterium]